MAMVWVGCLTCFYVHMKNIGESKPLDDRGPLDIFSGLLGSYGQAKRLQANVREWEGRYRMVVENSSDLILLVSQTGMILDTNRKATQSLGYTIEMLSHMTLQTIVKDSTGNPCNWPATWKTLFTDDKQEGIVQTGPLTGREWVITTQKGESRIFDTTLTPLQLQGSQAVMLVARDMTRRKELELEREELQAQLIHSQRLEAVGRLAGGVAHDFNNMLHAIQGSLDILEPIVETNAKARALTGNITTAVTRASTLTGQLLGFARAGKYEVVKIDIAELIHQSESLFRPILGKTVKLHVAIHPDRMIVEGDFTQLEQVLLNILINAHAALTEDKGNIVMRAEPATEYTPGWLNRPQRNEFGTELTSIPDGDSPDSSRILVTPSTSITETGVFRIPYPNVDLSTLNYIVIRIKDNGCGMDEATKNRIFEPFFTTKKQGGTGMGLAMAFGCIDNHHGWIHVETELGKGTEFFLFLPRHG
jgi:signal transduction histidine kinase